MRQVIQYQKTGEMSIENLPAPLLKRGGVLVLNAFSLISAGTERSSVSTAQASLIGKARSRPDLVRQVMDNAKREGLMATIEKVRNRLDNYKDLGYSCAGVVIESATDEFKAGDRVACGGVGYASHAEVVYVPKNLVAPVPDDVDFSEAAYTTVASIAMQGVRQADVRVGESVVVLGLGLLGLITVQILKASGCRVIGLDVSPRNFELAKKFGCLECVVGGPDSLAKVAAFTRGVGSDAVIITAATTSNEPVQMAIEYARKKSKVVVVGAVGMDIPRSPFYEKEIDFRISCSYGPGRYDSAYEEGGNDYPVAYVRWTEKRNMQSVLDLMATGQLDVKALTSHVFEIDRALEAYQIITGEVKAPHLGILLKYPETDPASAVAQRRVDLAVAKPRAIDSPVFGFIGAGNHTQSYLLPALKKLGTDLRTVVTSKPINANSVAKKFGFGSFATDSNEILKDAAINAVVIGTRHDTHGRLVIETMKAGKAVFVEKPLAITIDELASIADLYKDQRDKGAPPFLMVGYNRRFSEPLISIKEFMAKAGEPLSLSYRVNAGFLPNTNWYQGSEQGGRIVGEVCHFVDSMQFLTGSTPLSVYAAVVADRGNIYNQDNVSVEIVFADGSVGHIFYMANGAASMPKEYLEVYGGQRCATMDSFKQVDLFEGRNKKKKDFSGDKGHAAEMSALVEGLKAGKSPVSFDSLFATSATTFAILDSLASRARVDVITRGALTGQIASGPETLTEAR